MDLTTHRQMMRELRAMDPRVITDGPIVPDRYQVAQLRILWVLREANNKDNEGNGWDLCDFLASDEKLFSYSRWASTYGAVAVLSYGLFRNLPVEDVAALRARPVVAAIRDTAVINVNKLGGRERSTWTKLRANAAAFESLVTRQLRLLDPHIVIAAGTAELLPGSWRSALAQFQHIAIGCCRHNPGWLVKSYHTGQTTLSWGELYRAIQDALVHQGWPAQRSARGNS